MIAIRTEREIEILREANQIVARVHAELASLLRPGLTTQDLDTRAEAVIRQHGATPAFLGYRGYPASTCISVEEVVIHGIPGKRVIKEGQVVSVDVGVCYQGYYGDAAVTLACGEIDAGRRKLLEVTERALARGVKAAKAGNTIRDIGRAVEQTCTKAGFSVVRDFVGHGIGTAMHEEPQVPNFDSGNRGAKLAAGMVLAIEPMVNMGTYRVKVLKDGWTAVTGDSKPSAHFEHSVVVREHGGEVLSYLPGFTWGMDAGE